MVDFKVSQIGLGDVKVSFVCKRSEFLFCITHGVVFLNMPYVMVLAYRPLGVIRGRRHVAKKIGRSQNVVELKKMASKIDLVFEDFGRIKNYYTFIKYENRCEVIVPSEGWMRSNGYEKDIYSRIVCEVFKNV